METIKFSESAIIYKTKLNMVEYKTELLKLCNTIIQNNQNNTSDAFAYNKIENIVSFTGNLEIKNKIDTIMQFGIDTCAEIHKSKDIEYNMVETDSWVNVVRAVNPVQINFKEGNDKYHTHTELNKRLGKFVPNYTYVYYIQMPDNLINDDGVIYFKDKNNNEFNILPEEDDLIIMPADMPHSPNKAVNSTKDRIVFAGNVGFGFVKKGKSLI
jgi:hypothetical protein